ncbi:MAG: hypothetical protein KBT68_05775 [bacterium]|nr:hypothetical protein [Candidatus Colisoma equi]
MIPMNDKDGINRFLEAQKGDYEEALEEIAAGENVRVTRRVPGKISRHEIVKESMI